MFNNKVGIDVNSSEEIYPKLAALDFQQMEI